MTGKPRFQSRCWDESGRQESLTLVVRSDWETVAEHRLFHRGKASSNSGGAQQCETEHKVCQEGE